MTLSFFLEIVLLFGGGSARAEVQEMVYDLVLGENTVGRRRVTVRYLPSDGGEVRVLESYTELSVPLGRKSFLFVQRLSGMGATGPSGFVATSREMGEPHEVQLTERLSGWQVSLAEDGKIARWDLKKGSFDATSLTLVDPESATELLSSLDRLRVLSAETGKVVDGALKSLGSGTVEVAGTPVTVARWSWQLPVGAVELAYGPTGHLVRYNLLVGGRNVEATLREVPAPRTFGDNLDTPLMGPGIEGVEL
jgi:hypothetical protein